MTDKLSSNADTPYACHRGSSFSRLLTNQFSYPSVEDGLMWVCDSNLNRRVLLKGQDARYTEEKDGYYKEGAGYYSFAGYSETSVDLVEWTASRSGSKLLAQKNVEGWSLTLTQPEYNAEYEGMYQRIFSLGGTEFFRAEKEEREKMRDKEREEDEARLLLRRYGVFKENRGTSSLRKAFIKAERECC